MMDRSQRPAPYLVDGLRKLVDDIRRSERPPHHGLTDIVCGETELLSFGTADVLYNSISVEQLACSHTFEEVAWLLMHGRLPEAEELADWCSLISASSVLDSLSSDVFHVLPPGARPLDLFPFCISLLSFFDPNPQDLSLEGSRSRLWRLMAQLPLMLTAGLAGSQPGAVRVSAESELIGELSWAGRLLHWMRGGEQLPTLAEEHAINRVLTCQCVTEMRPACFAARCAASTTNLQTAVQAAATIFASQLRNDPYQWASELLRGFQTPSQAEAWWRRREGNPMPFGFSGEPPDPRAALIRECSQSLLGSIERIRVAAAAARLEKLLEAEHQLPTLDWESIKVLTLLNIPSDRQALCLGLARMIGWAAQAVEQQQSGVGLLPTLRYGNQETPES